MKIFKEILPRLPMIAILSLCIAAAYYFMWGQHLRFKEEIQLESGEIVVVQRVFKTSALGEVGGPGGWEAKFNSMVIIKPDHADNPPIWESDIGSIPILFDQDKQTKEWFLVTTFYMCNTWEKIGRPKLPYAEFRLRNGQWQQVELSPQHIGRAANVMTGVSSGGEPKLLKLAEKRARDADTKVAPEYIRIVDQWHPYCNR